MNREFESNGVVVTVGTEIKSKSNGVSKFVVCSVQHMDGPLAGKTYWAQRTVVSKNPETGEAIEKEPVVAGQEVLLYNRIQTTDRGTQIFSEISTSAKVDDLGDLLALVNADANAQAENALSGNN